MYSTNHLLLSSTLVGVLAFIACPIMDRLGYDDDYFSVHRIMTEYGIRWDTTVFDADRSVVLGDVSNGECVYNS